MLESVRLGKKAKSQLITLKRKTGVANWNILCRWAFAVSIAENTRPRPTKDSFDDGIEMTWRTFAGEHAALYEGLLRLKCKESDIEITSSNLTKQLRYHLSRGIGYLAGAQAIRAIPDLVALAAPVSHRSEPRS